MSSADPQCQQAVDGEQGWDWLCSHGSGAGLPLGAAAVTAPCQGAQDGDAVSWMREGCARLAWLLSLSTFLRQVCSLRGFRLPANLAGLLRSVWVMVLLLFPLLATSDLAVSFHV